ncbi:DUF4870 domain-containing protein [Salipaludibacillus daqingensis]|uniref:DUF4870 domain-containing protein n=1 Tax=Salipaludibacillus daqingensis TaxID=3041001 RepID=UPI002473C2F5|nr:DUF4870 domain-containing protein [Salipaludibacillus daqingensis]
MDQEKLSAGKSSTGLDENLGGLLAYLATFVTGIIFIIIEKENDFIRFHAMQSIFLFGGLLILNIAIGMIPFIGWIFNLLFAPIFFVLWIVAMYKAYKGERYKFPIVGDLAENQLKK